MIHCPLSELFTGKQQVWGLHMEPLGDYVDGKIVPFPEPLSTKTQQATTTTQKAVENTDAQVTETKIAPPVNIGLETRFLLIIGARKGIFCDVSKSRVTLMAQSINGGS